MKLFRPVLLSLFCIGMTVAQAHAQSDEEYGKILGVSGKTATVKFEQREINVGDEVEFWRFVPIVDPISGNERGKTKNLTGRGVVDEIGLGKTYVSITEQTGSARIERSDRALLTGVKKKVTRKTGTIQDISADNTRVTIDLGSDDAISEGDEFLIQRTENIFDPKTNKVIRTSQVDVGQGKVNTVKGKSSVAAITRVQPGMQVLKTDTVVFPAEQKSAPAINPAEYEQLRAEISRLRMELDALRATVDSLGGDHLLHRHEFLTLKNELERLVPRLMSGDIEGAKIVIKNAEPITRKRSDALLTDYRQALNDCLKHRYEKARAEFQAVMERFPDSPLVENCRYWIAQCDYNSGDYSAAAAEFQTVIDDSRFTHKDDDASIMLGITFFRTGRLKEALDVLHAFLGKYPESEYRDRVEKWIEKISMLYNRR